MQNLAEVALKTEIGQQWTGGVRSLQGALRHGDGEGHIVASGLLLESLPAAPLSACLRAVSLELPAERDEPISGLRRLGMFPVMSTRSHLPATHCLPPSHSGRRR